MQKKKGISLIVLIITIIVMIILASSMILTISNTDIIQKANKAVEDTDLAQIKHIAALAWSEAYLAGDRTKDKLEESVLKKFEEYEITEEDYKGHTLVVTPDGVDLVKDVDDDSRVSGKLPKGAAYYVGVTSNKIGDYTGATAMYTEGENFPEVVSLGDVYVQGDYEYRYGYRLDYDVLKEFNWVEMNSSGWSVSVLDRSQGKTSYGKILSAINNKDVISLHNTFSRCEGLMTVAGIEIPDTVTDISCMFENSINITNIGSLRIPNSVTDMSYAFSHCGGLTTLEGLTISDNVVDMQGTFVACWALVDLGDFKFPSKVENLLDVFSLCGELTTSSVIVVPSKVTDMTRAFDGCSKLSGTIEINANPTKYSECLKNTKITEITGSTNLKEEILNTK